MMLLVVSLILLVHTQAQTPDPICKDKIANCQLYGSDSCTGTYKQWAQENCAATCKFCNGPEQPCEDKDTTCDLYDKATCDQPNFAHWAETNCRYHCRRCTAEQLAIKDAQLTTLPPALCKDKLDCRQYGKSSCSGTYEHWAKINCMEFCGFCKGPPTPPHVCADAIPTCVSYGKSTCTDSRYTIWVQDNCASYCGVCKGSGPSTPGVPATQGPSNNSPGVPVNINTPPPLPTSNPGNVPPLIQGK